MMIEGGVQARPTSFAFASPKSPGIGSRPGLCESNPGRCRHTVKIDLFSPADCKTYNGQSLCVGRFDSIVLENRRSIHDFCAPRSESS